MPGADAIGEPKPQEPGELSRSVGAAEPSFIAAMKPDVEHGRWFPAAPLDVDSRARPEADCRDVPARPVNGESSPQGEPKAEAMPESPVEPRTIGLGRGDLKFVSVMLLVILTLSVIQLFHRFGWRATEIEVLRSTDDYRFTIDINTATWVEWLQLDGIGETLARRIVDHREQHGAFRSVEDLDDVRGIGPGTLEKIRPYLRCSEPVGAEIGE